MVRYTFGVTNNLGRMVYEHKHKFVPGFTSKYNINQLVYFEETPEVTSALKREKQLKKWNRLWGIKLIEDQNPSWKDMYENLV